MLLSCFLQSWISLTLILYYCLLSETAQLALCGPYIRSPFGAKFIYEKEVAPKIYLPLEEVFVALLSFKAIVHILQSCL